VRCLLLIWFFTLSCNNIKFNEDGSKPVIALQPYGNIDANYIDSVAASLTKMYQSKVIILETKALPASSFVNIKSPRYRADILIRLLKTQKPDSVDFILGLTNKDISTTKRDAFGNIKKPESRYKDWGVFGLGYRPGVACVISTFRLNHSSKKLFISRLQKVALHEIGHNYGLPHCKTQFCVMQDAVETIKTIDKVNPQLCMKCTKKIGLSAE
jgi:archaemetzincin